MEIWIKILVCFLAGAGAGIGTGFAGMSAAAVIGPLLATFLDIPAYQAFGIGLCSDVLASAVSAGIYQKNKNLDVKNSLPLLISVLGMTAVGSFVASFLPERAMSWTVQIGMIIIGLQFTFNPRRGGREPAAVPDAGTMRAKSVLGGIAVGFICGFMGAGGGIMLLFVLTSFLGYEMHKAVGTSVFIMTFTALTGGISHLAVGGIPDVTTLLLCMAFTLLWARIAAVIANKANTVTLNRVVGAVMILTGLAVLLVDYVL